MRLTIKDTHPVLTFFTLSLCPTTCRLGYARISPYSYRNSSPLTIVWNGLVQPGLLPLGRGCYSSSPLFSIAAGLLASPACGRCTVLGCGLAHALHLSLDEPQPPSKRVTYCGRNHTTEYHWEKKTVERHNTPMD